MPRKPHLRDKDNVRGAGLFSNYCGPGGAGRTVHGSDEACKKHDEAYGEYARLGGNPYLHHNKADEELVDDLKNRAAAGDVSARERVINLGAQAYFKGKKHVLPSMDPNIENKRIKTPHQGHLRYAIPHSTSLSILQWCTKTRTAFFRQAVRLPTVLTMVTWMLWMTIQMSQ